MTERYCGLPYRLEDFESINKIISEFLGLKVVVNFSGSIAHAWTLWERLRQSGRFCRLQLDSDYSYVYSLKLIEDPHESGVKYPEAAQRREPSFAIDADVEMPLLISLAFLWANNLEVPSCYIASVKKGEWL